MSRKINWVSDLCKREIKENTLAQDYRTNIVKQYVSPILFVSTAPKNDSPRNKLTGKFAVYLSCNHAVV